MLADEDLVAAGEARAAEIAREMVERGNYVLPSLNHQVSAHSMTKPPLFHWLLIASGTQLGWSNFAVHLVPALAALASILLVYLLGVRMFDRRAGLYAALVLASSIQFLAAGATARIDVLFAFLILAAITAFYYAVTDPGRRRALYLFYVCTGLAVLAKGPAGALLPLATALLYLWASGRLGLLRELRVRRGLALFALVALPWYAAVALEAPRDLAHELFFGQLSHWWEGDGAGSEVATAIWYYVPFLLFGMFPWSLFVPGALVYAADQLRRERRHPVLLLLVWFIGGLLVFSLGGKKAARYILPMLPAGAVLMGYYWSGLTRAGGTAHRAVHLACAAVVLATLLGLSALLAWGLGHPEETLARLVEGRNAGDTAGITAAWRFLSAHQWVTLGFAAAVTAASAAAVVAFFRLRLVTGSVATALMVWLLLAPYAVWVSPRLVAAESPRAVAAEIRGLVPGEATLYGGGEAYKHALRWYLERNITLDATGGLLQRAREDPGAWVLLMTPEPLPADVRSWRTGVREWQVDYYTVTLFPAQDPS